jgi:hypothetical protein
MLKKSKIALISGALSLAMPAQAAVTYKFLALSSYQFGNAQTSYTGGFTLTVPDFITTTTTVPLGNLSNCSVTESNGAPASCSDQIFNYNYYPGADVIQFVVSSANWSAAVNYYFDVDAFATVGTHDTIIFGKDQQGQLIVSADDSAVPEPASWALMVVGFGLAGGAMRSRWRVFGRLSAI